MKLNKYNRTSLLNNGDARNVDLCLSRTVCVCLFICSCFAVCRAATEMTVTEPNYLDNLENDLLLAKNPTTDPERQLWKARIGVSQEKEASQYKDELKELMQKISAIKFEQAEQAEPALQPAPQAAVSETDSQPAHEPVAIVEPVSQAEPNEVVAETQTDTVSVERKLPEGYISERTLQMFHELLKQPESLKSPFELAEILFRSDCLKEAAICYQTAFDRLAGDREDPYQDKAWILFQWGNCLQNDHPEAALEKYRMLVTEYPDCPWVDVAKAKSKLVDWRLKDKPVALINECRL